MKFDMLKIDVVTRWNSACDMVVRYLHLQTAVVAGIRSKELGYLRERDITSLSNDEAATAEDTATCLKPLKDITTMLCSENMPSAKCLALSLYHTSPKAYIMQKKKNKKKKTLPSISTLRRAIAEVMIYPGFSDNILLALRLRNLAYRVQRTMCGHSWTTCLH
jgi:hypothetical protein